MTIISSFKILKKTNQSQYSPEYTPGYTNIVIRDLFNKVKKPFSLFSDVHEACLDLMITGKNIDQLMTFWNDLKVLQLKENEDRNVPRTLFTNFIISVDETVLVNGVAKSCTQVVGDNLMEKSEVDNVMKQRELEEILFPYFHARNQTLKKTKNIVTAFIGVHRESDEAKDLIPKLNGKK